MILYNTDYYQMLAARNKEEGDVRWFPFLSLEEVIDPNVTSNVKVRVLRFWEYVLEKDAARAFECGDKRQEWKYAGLLGTVQLAREYAEAQEVLGE